MKTGQALLIVFAYLVGAFLCIWGLGSWGIAALGTVGWLVTSSVVETVGFVLVIRWVAIRWRVP